MNLLPTIRFYCLISCLAVSSVQAGIEVVDDTGQKIILEKAAKRIVSLAPHTTELLYASGATDQLIGTVSFSDYPDQAKQLARIGSYNKFDLEAIVALNPDLIVAWESGNTMTRINELKKLGYPVFINEPRSFDDIQKSILKLGLLLGTESVAKTQADNFLSELEKLASENKNKSPVKVFYQVWDAPLFTVNGDHMISRVIELCGGINVFHSLSVLSPQIGIESVLQKNPDVIVAGMSKGRQHWLDDWLKWPALKAVKNQQLYAINADLIVRHTPRILQGARKMCFILDRTRKELEQ